MGACWPGRRPDSFTEIGIRLVLFANSYLGERANKNESAYVLLAWHVIQKSCKKYDMVLNICSLFK